MATRTPMIEPKYTSIKKCCERYMRDRPTMIARPNQIHFIKGLEVSKMSAVKVANAPAVCPDGKLL